MWKNKSKGGLIVGEIVHLEDRKDEKDRKLVGSYKNKV